MGDNFYSVRLFKNALESYDKAILMDSKHKDLSDVYVGKGK